MTMRKLEWCKVWLLALVVGSLGGACFSSDDGGSSDDDDDDDGDQSDLRDRDREPAPTGGADGGDGADGGSQSTCETSDDCLLWYCYCEEGPPVNAATCDNSVCESATQVCPAACTAFSTSWTGEADQEPPRTGDGGGDTNEGSSDAGTPDEESPDTGGTATCESCLTDWCPGELSWCGIGTACDDYMLCVEGCGTNSSCMSSCESMHIDGASDYWALQDCAFSNCSVECQ